MKHGIREIIEYIKNLHGDAAAFVKGTGAGSLGFGILLFGAKIGDIDLVFSFLIKLLYTLSLGIMTGAGTVVGRKMLVYLVDKYRKRKERKKKLPPKDQNKNVA